MSLSVEIIKKRKNTTAPWEVRAIQSVIKQNFMDSPKEGKRIRLFGAVARRIMGLFRQPFERDGVDTRRKHKLTGDVSMIR